jgi:type IV pilus assembly protein PilE
MEPTMKNSGAFTVVEMLVVMTIMLILAALVYPSYRDHIVKAHRVEAQAAMLRTMQDQERYYSQHNTYVPFSADMPGEDEQRFQWWVGSSAARSAYELSARACGELSLQLCIEVRAVPGTAKVDANFKDPDCETLTLTSTGATGGRRIGCWP